jgi:hypothetical protein
MKVKVRFNAWGAGAGARGSAVPKPDAGGGAGTERWQYPPRYEVRAGEAAEKVVPIRMEAATQKAEVLPIRPGKGREPEVVTPAELAQAASHLLNPAAVLALALAVWGLSAEFGAANSFAVEEGPFSHWQTWLAVAGGIQFLCRTLRRRFGADAEQSRTGPAQEPAQ